MDYFRTSGIAVLIAAKDVKMGEELFPNAIALHDAKMDEHVQVHFIGDNISFHCNTCEDKGWFWDIDGENQCVCICGQEGKEQMIQLPEIRDMIGPDKKVFFSFFKDGELWYRAENGFEFPIPKDDMKGGLFKPEDKSIFFMRFIRKHLEYLRACVLVNDHQPSSGP